MKDKIKEMLDKLNKSGFPIPLLKDPKTDKGSLTMTMFWISFNLTILFALGKVSKVVGEVDFWEMLALTGMMGGFYLGRKYQTNKSGDISIGEKINEEDK